MIDQIRDFVRANKTDVLSFGPAIAGYLLAVAGLYLLFGEIGIVLLGLGVLIMGWMGIWTFLSFLWDGVYSTWIEDNIESET